MDNVSPHEMPFPPIHASTIMAPAMGGSSTAEDLLKYSMALLRSFHVEMGRAVDRSEETVIRNASMQLAGHIFTTPSMLEKSYAFGFYRSQLPNTILGMGWNSIYVQKMPVLVPKDHIGPVVAHGGSLPGYHVAMALLPNLDSSVVVCTNSIALGDVSGWISLAILEALMETPQPSNFVALAAEAAEAAASNISNVYRLQRKLDQDRKRNVQMRPLVQYAGLYRHPSVSWSIRIRIDQSSRLKVAFMDLDTQAWLLEHYEADTFLWLSSREQQAIRGRMTTYPLIADHFKLMFQANDEGEVDRLYWPHEAGLSLARQCFYKND